MPPSAGPADTASPALSGGLDRHSERFDRATWVAGLESCRKYLLLVANRELGNDLKAKEGASDLVQETLLAAHQVSGRFVGRTEAELRRWLRRLLMHKVAHSVRRYRRVLSRQIGREVSLDSGNPGETTADYLASDQTSPGGCAIRREEEVALCAALDRLPERMRLTVLWRHHEACSFDEIGRRLACPNVAARKLWLRALERLQRELTPEA
jgi:RNA polymerase sigma-70 factor (ECF subfamily)